MKVVLIAETADDSAAYKAVIAGIRALSPPVRIYVGSKRWFDYEHALTHGADGWIDIPKDSSGQD